MAEFYDPEDSFSTISADSTSFPGIAGPPVSKPRAGSSNSGKLVNGNEAVERLRELKEAEREIEEILKQNNHLMKRLLEETRESKSKVSTIQTDNVELKKKVSSLKSELDQKTSEVRIITSDKNTNAQRLKIDQAAAAVKDLRDQLYEKDKLLDTIKIKLQQEYSSLVDENRTMKVRLGEVESSQYDYEQKCLALTYSLEENIMERERASDQLMKEKKANLEYKNQLAVLSCQEVINLRCLESIGIEGGPEHLRRQLAALTLLMHTPKDTGSRSGMEGRGLDSNVAVALAASHGEPPPTSTSPYLENYRYFN